MTDTETYFDAMQAKVVRMDEIRRGWKEATDEERNECYNLFIDVEDCHRRSPESTDNFWKYLHYQPYKWTRFRDPSAVDLTISEVVAEATGQLSDIVTAGDSAYLGGTLDDAVGGSIL